MTERRDYDFCVSRSHYTDIDPTSKNGMKKVKWCNKNKMVACREQSRTYDAHVQQPIKNITSDRDKGHTAQI